MQYRNGEITMSEWLKSDQRLIKQSNDLYNLENSMVKNIPNLSEQRQGQEKTQKVADKYTTELSKMRLFVTSDKGLMLRSNEKERDKFITSIVKKMT